MTDRGRCLLLTLISLLIVTTASAQSGRVQPTPTPRPDDTERVLTEEIKLNVLAFDEDGKFVPNVAAKDLVITEDNILHQPESVRRLPASVLVVMDTGGDLRAVKSLSRTQKVAANLVNSLHPGDAIAVMDYSDKPEIVQEWTTDKAQALDAIARTNFGRRSAYASALKMATDFMLRSARENRHLVLITDGTDSGSRSSVLYDAYQRLMTTDITVHVISYTAMEIADVTPRTKNISNSPPPKALPDEVVNQLPSDVKIAAQRPQVGPTINMDRTLIKTLKQRKADLEASQQQLRGIADNTNGEFVLPQTIDEMNDKAALVSRMIDSSYVVTYTPKVPVAQTRGIAERNIQVTSKRPGLVVESRRKLLIKDGRQND